MKLGQDWIIDTKYLILQLFLRVTNIFKILYVNRRVYGMDG